MKECLHEMPREWCFTCKPKPPQQVWAALYEGVCTQPTCLKVIDVGELVTWNVEGTHVIHASHGRQ